jgi:hypothetical protein
MFYRQDAKNAKIFHFRDLGVLGVLRVQKGITSQAAQAAFAAVAEGLQTDGGGGEIIPL